MKITLPLILFLTTSFTSVFADDGSLNINTKYIQEQLIQQIASLLHFKSGYMPIDLSRTQVVEYSIIATISIVVIVAIASSVRPKKKKNN